MARGYRAFGALVLLAVLCTGTSGVLRLCSGSFVQQSDGRDCVLQQAVGDAAILTKRRDETFIASFNSELYSCIGVRLVVFQVPLHRRPLVMPSPVRPI